MAFKRAAIRFIIHQCRVVFYQRAITSRTGSQRNR
jgi:hypothetical protein